MKHTEGLRSECLTCANAPENKQESLPCSSSLDISNNKSNGPKGREKENQRQTMEGLVVTCHHPHLSCNSEV